MKKVLASGVVVLMVLFLSVGLGLARGPGAGGGGGGGGGGTGIPIHDIFSGTPFDYSGDVIEVTGVAGGGGIIIDIGGDDITIYGIGSVRYWDSLGVDRPVVSETIDVSGYNVEYSEGVFRNIAVTITVGGVEVPLRDLETGAPLWRGNGGNSN